MTIRRTWAVASALACIAATVVVIDRDVRPTSADSRPADPADPATPPTVTADALPTVQIDGVVWTQAVVGNTVFVGGRFDNARPAGAAVGQNQTPRSNFLAYDIRTGELIASIAPSFNAQVRTIVASPDGTRLYVGGDFTDVSGAARGYLAAFALPSMQLVADFAPPVGYHVHALAVSPDDDTLYVGGNFNSVGAQARNKLAAFATASGALLEWAPDAQGGLVAAMVLSPDGTKLVVGGKFTTLNGSSRPGFGLAAVDAVTGALRPWASNDIIRNATDQSSITSLVSDGEYVYGTAFARVSAGSGTLEGTFAASWENGELIWVADCHGDSYATHAQGDVVYSVGHAHFCGNIGGFPQTGGQDSSRWTYQRGLAFSRVATGTVATNTTGDGYFDFGGQPAPSPLHWYPDIELGFFTGQFQGPWHVTGTADHVVVGGEFEVVNGTAQQGLVRFAVADLAPNLEGPRASGAAWTPTVDVAAEAITVGFAANWDRDNAELQYRVERDGTVVGSVRAVSTRYERPLLTVVDDGAEPGATVVYRVVASDAFGNEAVSATVSVRVPGTPVPVTTVPVTTVPVTTVPVPTVPVTTVPVTTVPVTTVPVTTVPVTTAPVTTAPVTTVPVTTVRPPVTTVPVTTVPVTTVRPPVTTVPVTTVPVTTVRPPVTTVPVTTVPVTTVPVTTVPVTTVPVTTVPVLVDEPITVDGFGRDGSASGWGTSDSGDAWMTESPLPLFTVDGAGLITLDPGVGAGAFVTTDVRDVDVRADVAVDGAISGGGTYLSVVGRRVGAHDYRAKVRFTSVGGIELYLTRSSGVSRADGTEADLAATVLMPSGWSVGAAWSVRLQVTGASPTRLRAKAWPAGTPEPSAWNLTVTDGTPLLQSIGAAGLVGYLSASALPSAVGARFDDFSVTMVRSGPS